MNGWEDGFHNNNHHHNAILLLLLLRHVICRATILTTCEILGRALTQRKGCGNGSREWRFFSGLEKFRENTLVENYCGGSVSPPLLLSIDTNQVTA